MTTPTLRELMEKVMPIPECGCWIWMGGLKTRRYGHIEGFKSKNAHRVFYELIKGPIPEGLVIDHKCRITSCVNPDHLDAVTQRENTLRGFGLTSMNAKKTHCSKGHPLEPGNMRFYARSNARICLKCSVVNTQNWRKREKLKAAKESNP